MFGAIIGDIVGSRFEFDNCKSKEFELFTNTCDYTDDTVMTLAVAKALLLYGTITDMDAFKRELVRVMHEVGMLHPYCGYGGRFCTWMMKNDTEPYGSFGNGSAMRVSPVAWFAGSLDACEKLAAATAEVTHNHPEGIKGAVVVAGAIYLARMGRSILPSVWTSGTVDSSQRPRQTAKARRKCPPDWISTIVSIGVCLLLPKAIMPLCCTCSPAWMRKTAVWQWYCPMVFCSGGPARGKFGVSWWK